MRIEKLWTCNFWPVAALLLTAPIALVAQGGFSSVGAPAQRGAAPVATMPARQACALEKQILPSMYTYRGVRLVKDGIEVTEGRNKTSTLRYADIDKMEFSPGAWSHADLYVITRDKHGKYEFSFLITHVSNDRVQQLQHAIESLAQAASHGEVVCSDDPADYDHELADFDANTSAWRMMATKPALSDEAYKDRLLAEDAVKNEDMAGAAKYYELGVAADPTWDQGWFDLAILYSKMNDYFDAAQCMKHYVILEPSANDTQAAKDNIILWEAKAAQSAPAAQAGGAK